MGSLEMNFGKNRGTESAETLPPQLDRTVACRALDAFRYVFGSFKKRIPE
jgi:hypothetical protein